MKGVQLMGSREWILRWSHHEQNVTKRWYYKSKEIVIVNDEERMKVCKKKPISLRRVLRLPAPSSVQTGCLVWPSLNNWNNVHARRWMDGGLDTVHLKKLRLSFLRDFWHCTSENSLRDVFLVLCSGLKLSEATDRFMYKIGAKSSSF